VLRDHRRQQLEFRLHLGVGKSEPDTLVFATEDGTPMRANNMTSRWQLRLARAAAGVIPALRYARLGAPPPASTWPISAAA